MKANNQLHTLLLLSFFMYSSLLKAHSDSDPFLLRPGEHKETNIRLINDNESLYRLTDKYIVILDYKLLKEDFHFLIDKKEEDIDQIILNEIGYIVKTQVDLGEINGTNMSIPHEENEVKIGAIRQYGFGRALDLPLTDAETHNVHGYINVKGIGALKPQREGHKDGLMTLGEALREFTYSQIARMVFEHANVNYDVVRPYGVIYPGFSVKWDKIATDPAGFLLRRAYNRQDKFKQKNVDLEHLLNDYNIILNKNVQNTYTGDVVDWGHAIMGHVVGSENILEKYIPNFNNLYGHDLELKVDPSHWAYSKLDYMWIEIHNTAKDFLNDKMDRNLIKNVVNKYTQPIANVLFQNEVRNQEIKPNVRSLTPIVDRKNLVGHRLYLRYKKEIDLFFQEIKSGNLEMITERINKNKKLNFDVVNNAYIDGQTPLHWAVTNGNEVLVKLLLENGAKDSVNKPDNNGKTPLHKAAYKGNAETVKLLLENGAKDSVNNVDKDGKTPLHWAIPNGNEVLVKLLLENGGKDSTNKVDKYGQTPLHWAAHIGNVVLVKLLLENGAKDSVNKPDNNGKTSLRFTRKTAIIELLKQYGAK